MKLLRLKSFTWLIILMYRLQENRENIIQFLYWVIDMIYYLSYYFGWF